MSGLELLAFKKNQVKYFLDSNLFFFLQMSDVYHFNIYLLNFSLVN